MITTVFVYALIAYVLCSVVAVGLMIVVGLFERLPDPPGPTPRP